MLAARQQDPEVLRRQYESVKELVLAIDGLQPEKGHETLYDVRELTQKRVWFAGALISATDAEVHRLITKAKEWAESLDKPVVLWIASENLAENDPEATLTVLVGPVSSPATEADEESTIEEATTDPAGRVGTAISGNAEILARCRFVVEFRLPAIWSG
jgi:hypothetical protein